MNVPSLTLYKQVNESEELVLLAAWKRFGPNNFVLHSFAALNGGVAEAAYAHGIFPLASRLFNHSCYPMAWPAFVVRNKRLCERRSTCLKAKRCVSRWEPTYEPTITIPYLDPALQYADRQERLSGSYSFYCACPRCVAEAYTEEATLLKYPLDSLDGTIV